MGIAKLGNVEFRIDPDQIHYAYQVDFTPIDTLGGQVIQVLGSTTGDITIQGHFGQDHANAKESWQLAESFHAQIRALMDYQSVPPKTSKSKTHAAIPFTFFDGTHNWNFKVMIKGITDLDGNGSIEHSNGKFSYGYTLTLFLIEDSSLVLNKINTDKFISRIASGVGWSKNDFNGQTDLNAAIQYIQQNSTDGTFEGYLAGILQTKSGG